MNKELISQINELAVNQPRVHLMEKDLVADVKNARKDVLNDRIATDTTLMERIEKFTSPQALLLYLRIQLRHSREKLLIE